MGASAAKCLKVLQVKSSPGTPPRRRQLYVKSFSSPKKNIKKMTKKK